MRIKLIACEALYREFLIAAAKSPFIIDITFMPFGLHDRPADLRSAIQKEIDESEGGNYEYVLLGYGLCSRGTAEVKARTIPLVVPRAHDCITFFLGSRARYQQEFSANPGTYYYSAGWIERKDGEVKQGYFEENKEKERKDRYQEYIEKYGEDNAKFLIEQESQWLDHYTRAAFINTDVGNIEAYRKFTQQLAHDHDWEYQEINGDTSMIEHLTNGKWDNEDFLMVKPGQTIIESFDEHVLRTMD